VSLIWTTFAEFPGTVVAIFLIDWLGRKKTLAICALRCPFHESPF
jgi:hypothetical protein